MSDVAAMGGIIACEGCGAEIFFVPTTRGKMAPVEAEGFFLLQEKGGPVAGFAKTEGGPWPYVRGRKVDLESPDLVSLAETHGPLLRVHVSHHARCAKAPSFSG